jgi:hypothetical protein
MPSVPKQTAKQIIEDLKKNKITTLQFDQFISYELEEYQAILAALKTNKSVNTFTPDLYLINDDYFTQYLDLLASKKEITTLNLNDHVSNISSRWDLIALGLKDNQTITTLNTKSTNVMMYDLLGIFKTNFTITTMTYNSLDSIKEGKSLEENLKLLGDLVLQEQEDDLKTILEQNKQYQVALEKGDNDSMKEIVDARSELIEECLVRCVVKQMAREGEEVRNRSDSSVYSDCESPRNSIDNTYEPLLPIAQSSPQILTAQNNTSPSTKPLIARVGVSRLTPQDYEQSK